MLRGGEERLELCCAGSAYSSPQSHGARLVRGEGEPFRQGVQQLPGLSRRISSPDTSIALAAAVLVRQDLLMTAAVRVCLPGGQENLPSQK
jgi:hypothetical protein